VIGLSAIQKMLTTKTTTSPKLKKGDFWPFLFIFFIKKLDILNWDICLIKHTYIIYLVFGCELYIFDQQKIAVLSGSQVPENRVPIPVRTPYRQMT